MQQNPVLVSTGMRTGSTWAMGILIEAGGFEGYDSGPLEELPDAQVPGALLNGKGVYKTHSAPVRSATHRTLYDYLEMVPQLQVLNVQRDPVDQFLSIYHYFRHHCKQQGRETWFDTPDAEFLPEDDLECVRYMLYNPQSATWIKPMVRYAKPVPHDRLVVVNYERMISGEDLGLITSLVPGFSGDPQEVADTVTARRKQNDVRRRLTGQGAFLRKAQPGEGRDFLGEELTSLLLERIRAYE